MHFRWLILMAWRDSRRNRSRLLLFISSIVLGIAGLVAIYTLASNVRTDIDQQAAGLLGADIQISSNKAVDSSMQQLIDSIGGIRSEEQSFASMVYFPKNNGTRLVQIRALEGAFPYYDSLETDPIPVGKSFRNKQSALVDKTLMLQYNARPGDSIRVGNIAFVIAGTLLKAPGQTGFSAAIAPTVFIPLQYLQATGLSQKGSRINYRFYYVFNDKTAIKALAENLAPRLEKAGLDVDTVETKKVQTGRSFADLTNFLSLVGFIALLLGCIGVASSIQIYIKEKTATIAILRCLGATAGQSFIIYLIQIAAIGLAGAIGGAALGTIIQQFLPYVLKDFTAINITTAPSWAAIAQGVALGLLISLLFGLLPLISLRKISPLNTLRVSDNAVVVNRDPARWLVYALIVAFIVGFSYLQLGSIKKAFVFTGGVLLAFLLLTGAALLLIKTVRKYFPGGWSYLWRQGLANLFRPNNQTVILIVSIGLGTFFISTLFSVQSILLGRISLSASGNQPNMVLFDIQTAQEVGVAKTAQQFGLPIIQQVPIVNMRLETLNGKTPNQLQGDDTAFSKRAFTREYRVTYRDSLTSSETITVGKWIDTAAQSGLIPISIEQGWAKRQALKLGDTMVFNVQGARMETVVASFREVDWNRVQTNFLIVFPTGVLEKAPQFHVLITRVKDDAESARFQQAMVVKFPNVSIIDLGLVLKTLDEILEKIAFVIRFMAGFSILTGLVVLIASVLISKYQRIQESVLLRTLGASRRQVLQITAIEYFFLGAMASFTGIFLSVGGSWALAIYTFKTPFEVNLVALLILMASICLLTIIIGLINIQGLLNKTPLEVLRKEA